MKKKPNRKQRRTLLSMLNKDGTPKKKKSKRLAEVLFEDILKNIKKGKSDGTEQ
jgi:hypothetical protein